RRARGQIGRTVDLDLEVPVAQPLRGRPVRGLAEMQAPAGAVRDWARADHRQRPRISLEMEHRADGEAILRSGGQDLDADGAAKAVQPAHAADDEARGLAQAGSLRLVDDLELDGRPLSRAGPLEQRSQG